MFCQVERAYIEDSFNLYGLRACVSNFSDCLDLILDRIGPEDSDDSHLTQSACTLYGLIHARYIVTTHGLDSMYNKYAAKEFGTCPLIQCNGQPVLPVGLRDEIGVDTAKIFCPKCKCVYQPPPIRSRSGGNGGGGAVDGAAFGTTFPHLFLMTFNNLVPDPLPQNSAYVPRVFGFRVHKSAHRQSSVNSAYGLGARRSSSYNRRSMASSRATVAPPAPIPATQVKKQAAAFTKEAGRTEKNSPEPHKEKDSPKKAEKNDAVVEGVDVKEEGTVNEEANDAGVAAIGGNSNPPIPNFISKKRINHDNGSSKKKRQKRVEVA